MPLPCPLIVDRETFERVQAIRKVVKIHAQDSARYDLLCQGLVTCGCGWKWGAKSMRWLRKGVMRRTPLGMYYCKARVTQPEVSAGSDGPKSVGAKKLDTWVWGQVCALLDNPSLMESTLKAELAHLREGEREAKAEVERLQKALDHPASERQRVITQARKGRITDDDMDSQLGALTLQEMALRRDLAQSTTAAEYRQRARDVIAFSEKYLRDIAVRLKRRGQPIPGQTDESMPQDVQAKRELVRNSCRAS